MISDRAKQATPNTLALTKLAFLVFAYVGAAVVITGTMVNLLVDKLHAEAPRFEFTLGDILGAMAALPTIVIAIAAWIMRDRWIGLRTPQLLVAAVAMALLNTPVLLLIVAATNALFHFEHLSPTTWGIVWRILVVLSAVVVAQVLRLGRRSTTSAYV